MNADPSVLFETDLDVAAVTLNRPNQGNRIGTELALAPWSIRTRARSGRDPLAMMSTKLTDQETS
jgi:enoyl-CoA hydratase/carnithine racemase